jgi:hypothetical protein
MSERAEHVFTAKVGDEIPEHIELRFGTSEPQGGNHSHGANATLEMYMEGGAYEISIDVEGKECFRSDDDTCITVHITALGDWESEGLTKAMLALGQQLATRFSIRTGPVGHLVWTEESAGR